MLRHFTEKQDKNIKENIPFLHCMSIIIVMQILLYTVFVAYIVVCLKKNTALDYLTIM